MFKEVVRYNIAEATLDQVTCIEQQRRAIFVFNPTPWRR